MAGKIYLGRDGTAHNSRKGLIGVDGKARALKKVYVGVANKARLVYTSYTPVNGIALTWGDVTTVLTYDVAANLTDGRDYDGYSSSVKITAAITPKDATNQNIKWSITRPTYNYAGSVYTQPYRITANKNSCTVTLDTGSYNELVAAYHTYGKGKAVLAASTADGVMAQVSLTMGTDTNFSVHGYFYIRSIALV